MAEDKEISASVLCQCGKLYDVRWAWSRLLRCVQVYGLPVAECACGVLSETLEHEARASLDLDARLELAKRDAELRRRAEEALDLLECEACGKAMRVSPSVEALVKRHGVPIHCDMPMRTVAAQEAAL